MLHQQKRKYPCPACGKACSSLSTVVGFLSQSWQCGSLPATWWSGAETRRTVPRNLWGVGWMGTTLHFRSEDLQKWDANKHIASCLTGNKPWLKVKWGTQPCDHLFSCKLSNQQLPSGYQRVPACASCLTKYIGISAYFFPKIFELVRAWRSSGMGTLGFFETHLSFIFEIFIITICICICISICLLVYTWLSC